MRKRTSVLHNYKVVEVVEIHSLGVRATIATKTELFW